MVRAGFLANWCTARRRKSRSARRSCLRRGRRVVAACSSHASRQQSLSDARPRPGGELHEHQSRRQIRLHGRDEFGKSGFAGLPQREARCQRSATKGGLKGRRLQHQSSKPRRAARSWSSTTSRRRVRTTASTDPGHERHVPRLSVTRLRRKRQGQPPMADDRRLQKKNTNTTSGK